MIHAMASLEGVVGGRRSTLLRVWRRVGRRSDGRPPLWIEFAVIGWLFYLYDVINDFAPIRQELALRDAIGVLNAEHWLHIAPERSLNHWLGAQGTLALGASYYYFFAHAVVTFAVLAWLWWRRAECYPRLRLQLVIINLIAFVVFWRYPLAPPRMFPRLGFIDVIASSHAAVSWHSGALVHDADQFAAMPSLHVAWAAWCAIAIWQISRRRAIKALAVAYPLVTSVVVVATGNHYLLDVFAGGVTVAVALALHRALERVPVLRRRRRVAVAEPADHAVLGLEPADHAVRGVPVQP
jgi:membrane-associated phospholipid phosphatase